MSNIFAGLSREGHEEVKDVLGGGRIYEQDVYDGIIKLAYVGKSQTSNSQSVTFHVQLDEAEYRETIWITNKEGQNFYKDKNGKTQTLPGFVTLDDICLLSTGLPLANQTSEEKVIMLYDFEHKKDMPKNVVVFTSLQDLPITLALDKNKEDITQKVEGSNPAQYVPTGKTKMTNSIAKVFHTESRKTTVELREGQPAIFLDKWVEKNKGKDRDKTAGANNKAGTAARPGQPAASGGKPATSLFNKGG